MAACLPTSAVLPNSGSSKPISRLLHSKTLWRSSSGTPTSSAMTMSGNSAATSRTKSQWPSGVTRSRISAVVCRIRGSKRAVMRGVNPWLTSLRYFECCGGSMFSMMVRVLSRSSLGRSRIMVLPRQDE